MIKKGNPQLEDGYIQIAHEIIEALMRTNLSSYQTRIILAVFRKTYGWHKKEDWIAQKQLVEMTGITKGHVSRTVKELKLRNIVTNSGNKLAFNKDYKGWRELPKGARGYQFGQKVTRSGKKVTNSGGHKKYYTKNTIQKIKKAASPFAEKIYQNHPRKADKKNSINSIVTLLSLMDDKVSQYPELKVQEKEIENIVKARFQMLWNCQENYKQLINEGKIEKNFVIQSNNFFGRAERWREFIETRIESKEDRMKRLKEKAEKMGIEI